MSCPRQDQQKKHTSRGIPAASSTAPAAHRAAGHTLRPAAAHALQEALQQLSHPSPAWPAAPRSLFCSSCTGMKVYLGDCPGSVSHAPLDVGPLAAAPPSGAPDPLQLGPGSSAAALQPTLLLAGRRPAAQPWDDGTPITPTDTFLAPKSAPCQRHKTRLLAVTATQLWVKLMQAIPRPPALSLSSRADTDDTMLCGLLPGRPAELLGSPPGPCCAGCQPAAAWQTPRPAQPGFGPARPPYPEHAWPWHCPAPCCACPAPTTICERLCFRSSN